MLDAAHECAHSVSSFAGRSEEASLGNCSTPVTCASDTLQSNCDRPRGLDLADQIDEANIDSELQRGGRDQDFDFAIFQPVLGFQSNFARQTSMVRGDEFFADALGEMQRNPFGHADAC